MSTSVDLGIPYFQTCAPLIFYGALDSPKDGSNAGICQSINQAAYEWALKHASPVATRRWWAWDILGHQISEVQLETLIASIVNLARYCFDMNRNLRTLVSVGRTESCTMFLGSLYNPCPGSIRYTLLHPPFPGIVPSGCTILRLVVWNMSSNILQHFATCCKHDAGWCWWWWWWWWWWTSPMTSIIFRGLKHYPSVALGGTGSLPEVRPEIVLCRGHWAES